MRINREREKRLLKVSQVEYVKVSKRFNIEDTKHVNIPLEGHFKLSEA